MTHIDPETYPRWYHRLGAAVKRILELEPVAVQAAVRALVALVVAAGVTIPDWVEPRAVGIVGAFYLLVEVVTTMLARRKVTPEARVVERVEVAADGQPVVVAGAAHELEPSGHALRTYDDLYGG